MPRTLKDIQRELNQMWEREHITAVGLLRIVEELVELLRRRFNDL